MGIRERFMEAVYNTGDWASPVFGMDRDTYHNFLMRALSGDENVPASVLTRVKVSLGDAAPAGEGEQRKWWTQFLFRRMIERHLEDIDGLIARYREMAEWHREQAEAARGRMTEAADRLAEIEEFLSGVDDLLEDMERTGKLDREKAIEILKSRGVEIDPGMDNAALQAALMSESKDAAGEKIRWTEQYEQGDADSTRHGRLEEENLRKAQELVDRRDAIRTGKYDLAEEERRLREVAEEYREDVQRRAFKLEKQRYGPNQDTNQMEVERQAVMNNSQNQDQEADFLASLDNLTPTYNLAAADAPSAEPSPDAPAPKWPKPGGLGSSA